MSAIRKRAYSLGENIFFLGLYVKKELASNERLLAHGIRAYRFQEQILLDEDACYENGTCPCCGMELVDDDSA